jgi:hypothetical protein
MVIFWASGVSWANAFTSLLQRTAVDRSPETTGCASACGGRGIGSLLLSLYGFKETAGRSSTWGEAGITRRHNLDGAPTQSPRLRTTFRADCGMNP